jgi:hypothetical protein
MSDIPAPKKAEQEQDPDEDHFYPHWKHHIDINLVCDDSLYNKSGSIPSEIAKAFRGKIDWGTNTYQPIIYLSDWWLLKKDMRALNDTLDGETLNLSLKFKNYLPYNF